MRLRAGAGPLLASAALLAACANAGPPPGGPPRLVPPAILMISPDSGAILPQFSGDAVIQFDEVIDEMAGGGSGGGAGGTSGLAQRIILSPVAGPVNVSWHRSSIHVKPKEGWKPGRVYHLQLLPGVVDLHRNVMKRGRTILFSTGPAIPTASLSGIVVSWAEQRTLPLALIRAVLKPDTLAYLALADSTGRFRLDNIPPGQYTVFGVNDGNSNRLRDPREPYDSATVTVDSSAAVNLWTFVHDTLPPRIRNIEPIDSLSFRLNFTAPLGVTGLPDTASVRVYQLPDSTPVATSAVLLPAANDSLVNRLRAAADSAARAADTSHAAADTTPSKRDTTRAGRAPAPARVSAPPSPSGARQQGAGAAPDSTAIKLIASRPAPTDKLVVRVTSTHPLLPSTKYFVRVVGLKNLNGARGDAVGVLAEPAPPKRAPAADSTKKAPPK